MENKKIEQFLKEAKEERNKRIMGIKMDIFFFDKWLIINNEDKLRDELEEENKKLEKDEKGNVIKDGRDRERITILNAKIDKILKIKNQRLQYVELLDDLKFYLEVIDDIKEEDGLEIFN